MRSLSQKVESYKEDFVRPTILSEMKSRAQVHLIDMQSPADGKNKLILVNQDNLTKFLQFRPCTHAPDIAY